MKKITCALIALLMVVSLTACGGSTPTPAGTPAPGTTPAPGAAPAPAPEIAADEKEAPMLAAQVAAGTIPALNDRMPVASDIMIETDIETLGQYGGELVIQANDGGRWTWGMYTEQPMFRFKQDGSGEVEPNVCKDFYSNDDATVWTIVMREGLKWSDGVPLTADDVVFYYEHMSTPRLNEDGTVADREDPSFYNVFTTRAYNCFQVQKDGKRHWAKFEKVNDYELTVTFAAPKPAFPVEVAIDNKWLFLPKHFYKNYVARKDGVTDDPDFPLITEEVALANGNRDFKKSWDSYSSMGRDIGYYHWDYHIVPQVRSFVATADNWNVIGDTFELVRNPYFFKTDSEGRQLPYLDKIEVRVIKEKEQITLSAVGGEFDIHVPDASDLATVSTALDSTHNVVVWPTAKWSTDHTLALNQTVKDLDKRALFQDIRFREALSICVDRGLLSDTLTNGISKPKQASVNEGLTGYDEQWTKKWTEFDVAKANALLDELTEPWNGADNTYRKMKGTNKDVEIIVSMSDISKFGDFLSLLQSHFKAVGVKLLDDVTTEIGTRTLTNDIEAIFETAQVSTPALRPDTIVPMRNVYVWYSSYGRWYEDGKTEANGGITPPPSIMGLLDAHEAIKSAMGPNRQAIIDENVQKIYDLHKENTWIIGYLEAPPYYIMVNKNLHNVPEGLLYVDEFRNLGFGRPEQFYKSE